MQSNPRKPLVVVGNKVQHRGTPGHDFGDIGRVVSINPTMGTTWDGKPFYWVAVDRDAVRGAPAFAQPRGKFLAADHNLVPVA